MMAQLPLDKLTQIEHKESIDYTYSLLKDICEAFPSNTNLVQVKQKVEKKINNTVTSTDFNEKLREKRNALGTYAHFGKLDLQMVKGLAPLYNVPASDLYAADSYNDPNNGVYLKNFYTINPTALSNIITTEKGKNTDPTRHWLHSLKHAKPPPFQSKLIPF